MRHAARRTQVRRRLCTPFLMLCLPCTLVWFLASCLCELWNEFVAALACKERAHAEDASPAHRCARSLSPSQQLPAAAAGDGDAVELYRRLGHVGRPGRLRARQLRHMVCTCALRCASRFPSVSFVLMDRVFLLVSRVCATCFFSCWVPPASVLDSGCRCLSCFACRHFFGYGHSLLPGHTGNIELATYSLYQGPAVSLHLLMPIIQPGLPSSL